MSRLMTAALFLAAATVSAQAEPRLPRAGGDPGVAPAAQSDTDARARLPRAGGETGLVAILPEDAAPAPRRPRGGHVMYGAGVRSPEPVVIAADPTAPIQ